MEQTVVRDPMSLDEFFALDIELVELVGGQPVLLSAATGPHQVAVTKLLLRLAPEVVALRADGDRYVEVARLVGGTTGTLLDPVEIRLDPGQLLV